MALRVKYWGVRGSLPAAPPPDRNYLEVQHVLRRFFQSGFSLPSQIEEFMALNTIPSLGGYGTATTCVEVQSAKGAQIIIDGGSGIRNLSELMMKGSAGKGKSTSHIFLTHFHWDHLIGLPFFTPNFIKGNRINFYAVQPELESMIRGLFKRPYFPVAFEALAANIHFYNLAPRQPIQIEDMTITPYQLDHPDPCWGFKVKSGNKVYSHCVDTEGVRTSREAMGPDVYLYQGVDLCYFDAQYTLPELVEKANWGHSAAQIGVDIALRENIPHLLFAHHDPGADTARIHELRAQTEDYCRWRRQQAESNHQTLPELKWDFAHEGLEINL